MKLQYMKESYGPHKHVWKQHPYASHEYCILCGKVKK